MNAGSPNSASNIRASNIQAMSILAHWDTHPSADFSVGGEAPTRDVPSLARPLRMLHSLFKGDRKITDQTV